MIDPLDTGGATLHAFVNQVRHRGSLATPDEADQVTRATLAGLSDAVSSGQLQALGAALPPELRGELTGRQQQAKAFDKDAFLDRVAGYTGTVDLDTAEQQVRAVLSTVADWQPTAEIDDTLAQLPPGLADLFTTHRQP